MMIDPENGVELNVYSNGFLEILLTPVIALIREKQHKPYKSSSRKWNFVMKNLQQQASGNITGYNQLIQQKNARKISEKSSDSAITYLLLSLLMS